MDKLFLKDCNNIRITKPVSILPPEYQEVDFLQSSGTQYIDLSIAFMPTDSVKLDASIQDQADDKYILMGNPWNSSGNRYAFGVMGGKFLMAYGSNSTGSSKMSQSCDTARHTWTYENKICKIDGGAGGGTSDMSSKTFGATSSGNIRIFYGYNAASKATIYEYIHSRSGEEITHLIPCYRKSDNVAGMYDLISNTFLTNSGTGSFSVGPVVNYPSSTTITDEIRNSLQSLFISNCPEIDCIGTLQDIHYWCEKNEGEEITLTSIEGGGDFDRP